MKKVLLTMALLWACTTFAYTQTLPTISSATYETVAPKGDSPNSATSVKVMLPSSENIEKVIVTVTDSGSNVLHTQEYDASLVTPSAFGGYVLLLKFYTDADLSSATISIELADNANNKGAAFIATAQ